VHFIISEHSAGYHRFWTETFFGGFDRVTRRRISDWSRFRVWRMLTWIFWIAIIAVVTGKIIHTSPILALLRGPQLIWHVLQFVALFWFMSRGGVDVYYPDDIKTRFSDVWGQDHVLERVKENIIFLENPELVEERGGYVPGGLLLWGPPGTGKTLMAEAVAGETGRPYVFVDPGAFINMFMGVGILKVKSLFRKLRRLALLPELSGLKKPRGFVNRYVRRIFGMRPKPPPRYRILVMMATNMPSALDEALLRPGRIDRIYKVGYPSKAGRIRTYEGYFS